VDTDAFAQLLRRQASAFTIAQAIAAGMPRSTLESRRQTGRYVTLYPGVLAPAEAPRTPALDEFAAVLSCSRGPGPPSGEAVLGRAVLSHHSAARRHGLRSCPAPDAIHITVPWDRRLAPRQGIVIHRSRSLDRRCVIDDAGVPLTSPTRTVRDLEPYLGPRQLRRIVAELLRSGRGDADGLREEAARHAGRPGRPGRLAPIIDELSPLHATSRSALESLFVEVTSAAGIPPSSMNHHVVDVRGRDRYIDAVYLPEHVPVELDGALAHGSALDRRDDLERENAITLSGRWRSFLRFTWNDLTRRPEQVVEEIHTALDAARLAVV
jgi:hypothetical protein